MRRQVLAFGLAMAVLGCGEASDPEPATEPVLGSETETSAFALAADEAAASGFEPQQQAFSDGVIDVNEYHDAIEATIRCLIEDGFEVGQVGADWTGASYDYGVSAPVGREGDYQRCYERHAEWIDFAWQMSFEEERLQLVDAVAACLEAAGVPSDQLREPSGAPKHIGLIGAVVKPSDPELYDRCTAGARDSRGDLPALPPINIDG